MSVSYMGPFLAHLYTKSAKFARLYFRISQYFATKPCNSTNPKILFLAVAKDFGFFLALIEC